MYEGLGEANHRLLATPREQFAIKQYNLSLNQLTSATTDESIVLLVCLLFICIEMLQGNKDAAIEHCRHGITICNNMSNGMLGWAKQELQPIFLRLATFPYFFGVEVTDFPEPIGLVSDPLATDVTAEEKDTAWNYLINRAVRLVRLGLSHRQGPLQHLPVPDSLFEEQQSMHEVLVMWHDHYRTNRTSLSIEPEDLERHIYDEMKCIVGKIWVACCLNKDEMDYDEYNADFEELIHLSEQLVHLRSMESGPTPKFIFEMGFMPILYFIVINCRRLDIRLTALRHIPLISHEQENLFNSKTMYYVAMRSVELEHGIHIDPDRIECAGAFDASVPPDEVRIRSADICCEWEIKKDENGQEYESRKVFFNVKPDAIVSGFIEWVRVGSFVGRRPSRCCGSTAEGGVCCASHDSPSSQSSSRPHSSRSSHSSHSPHSPHSPSPGAEIETSLGGYGGDCALMMPWVEQHSALLQS